MENQRDNQTYSSSSSSNHCNAQRIESPIRLSPDTLEINNQKIICQSDLSEKDIVESLKLE